MSRPTHRFPTATEPDDGPIEFPPFDSNFANADVTSTLQIATSGLLIGAISVFLFRSLHRRARSTGAKKSLKEEAMESLKAITPTSVDTAKSPPSAVQASWGGLSIVGSGMLIINKFTTTIKTSINSRSLSDNF